MKSKMQIFYAFKLVEDDLMKVKNVLLIPNAIVTSVNLIRLDTKASDVNHALEKRPAMNHANSTRNAAAKSALVEVHLSQFVVEGFETSLTSKS